MNLPVKEVPGGEEMCWGWAGRVCDKCKPSLLWQGQCFRCMTGRLRIGQGTSVSCLISAPSTVVNNLLSLLFPYPPLQLADIDSSPSKDDDDDDDDTMQNTVVLFSNTDKFVLMQVGVEDEIPKN